jgi:tRNA A64-2'-O-ribosylphosphate transferase
MDRGDLDTGLQDLKDGTTALEAGLQGLELDHTQESTTEYLTGVPISDSRLAVNLGPPVVPVNTWSIPSDRTINIWIVEINKAQTYPETIYIPNSEEKIRHIGLALPSPKADSWGYKSALIKLVSSLRTMNGNDALIIRSATLDHLNVLVDPPQQLDDVLRELDTPQDQVSSRKTLIPIILLLLCAFPALTPGSSVNNGPLDKAGISTVLLSLVALWPDGNPPRAALKRVNEILLGSSRD